MEKPPRSPAQIEASRANGARSHGPTSDAGKAASARNSLKHGLTARSILLANENPEHFEELLHTLAATFLPESGVEQLAVEEMAVALWKQRRIWTLEATTIGLQDAEARSDARARLENPDAPAETCLAWHRAQKSLADFSWHDVRLQRQYARALQTLERLQTARRKKKVENEPENFSQNEAQPEAA